MEHSRFEKPFIVWHYTNECNFRCNYCFEDSGSSRDRELSLRQKYSVIDKLVAVDPKLVAITGGEPLVSKDFWQTIDYISGRLPFCIGSNGYLMDHNTIDRLIDAGMTTLNVSMQSSIPEKHDAIRGMKGSFEKVVDAVKYSVKKHIPVELSIVAMRSNYDEIPGMIQYCNSLGVKEIELIDFKTIGRGKNMMHEQLNAEEQSTLFDIAYDSSNRHTRVWCFEPRYPAYRNSKTKDSKEIVLGCGAANGMYAIQSDGNVTPCSFLTDTSLGNINVSSMERIIKNPTIVREYHERERLEGECGSCAIKKNCGGCRARAHALTGNVWASDPSCTGTSFIESTGSIENMQMATGK